MFVLLFLLELSEEWTDCQEPVKEGFTFYCRYLGSTPIEQSSNATMTSHAVKHILSMVSVTLCLCWTVVVTATATTCHSSLHSTVNVTQQCSVCALQDTIQMSLANKHTDQVPVEALFTTVQLSTTTH